MLETFMVLDATEWKPSLVAAVVAVDSVVEVVLGNLFVWNSLLLPGVCFALNETTGAWFEDEGNASFKGFESDPMAAMASPPREGLPRLGK